MALPIANVMSSERLRRVESLFHAARNLSADERAGFLAQACSGDEALRSEVDSLLAHAGSTPHLGATGWLDAPLPQSGSAVQTSLVGKRLGPYSVAARIGEGGMGEVYRARDEILHRDVALKVLPEAFALDANRLARFKREAQILAALNHPHIGHIYGFENAHGVQALVLELVEGPTLADRIAQGPMPMGEVLFIARQIAEALEAAHEQGIIHRDLKPANIKVRPDGAVKVLDFGLAKAAAGNEPAAGSQSATLTPLARTRPGVLLGTAAYMSPEQARGLALDRRTDIWAFGCILYEMLTGRNPFARATLWDTLAAVVETEPDWTALQEMPALLETLVRRCLHKDPKRRLHDLGDARIEMEDLHAAQPAATRAARGRRSRRSRSALVAATVVATLASAAIAVSYLRPGPETAPAMRLSISTTGRITPQLSVAVSPDGRRVAFVATDSDGRSVLWVRPLDSLDARAIPGTENAAHPFWSPDGQSLGFIAAGKLKRVDVEGVSVQTLADTVSRLGGAWNRDGTIVFSPAVPQLATVPASGGPVSRLAAAGAWPSFLPDGRHFLYWAKGTVPASQGVYVGSLDSTDVKQLITSEFKGAYAAPGYLLFVRDETLMAQAFDTDRLKLRGEPFVVAEGIWGAAAAAQASFSVSPTGTLAYVNATLYNTQFVAFDRSGHPLGSVTPPDRYFNRAPQLSPSGKQLAIARGRDGHDSIWLFDRSSGSSSRLTVNPDWSDTPVWSADGSRLVFMSGRGPGVPGSRLNLRNVSGSGQDKVLLEFAPPVNGALWDWSPDGRFAVYSVYSPETKGVSDLWVLPLDGASKPYPFLQSTFHKTQAQIAPNGRWIVYTSYESGKDEIYIQRFPIPGDKRQISIDGGVQPRWRRDGAELFYLATNQSLMAVPVKTDDAFEAGSPVPLFRTKILPQGSQSLVFYPAYDVTADGQQFVLNVPPEDPGPPITVVLNWVAAKK